MEPILVKNDIYMLSVNAEKFLFEEMWEIPEGVTLNSYIVKGEKTAIIDGVIGWDGVPEHLYSLLEQIDVKPENIDYLIINHLEPDHSGWLENFNKITKDFEIYCTAKAADILEGFYGMTERVHTIKAGETLDLGNGKVLRFEPAPNVHWPDTMVTFEESTKTVFTCDMFGSYGKLDENHFDDQFTDEQEEMLKNEEIRYYATVLATFNNAVIKALNKVKELEPDIIAPGHGPVYRTKPNKIIERYEKISRFACGETFDEITVLWGSMYGMTEKAVIKAIEYLESKGIKVNNIRVPETDLGEVLSNVIRSKAVIIGAPTYEYKMFPGMAIALDELGRKKIGPKTALHIGSFGWSGGAEKELCEIIECHRMKWDFIEPVEFKGAPSEEDFERVRKAIDELLEKIK